jgi:hypothetical protein
MSAGPVATFPAQYRERMMLVTVRLPRDATMDQAVERLGLSPEDVDAGYGLVPIDPGQGLYALRVTEEAAGRIDPAAGSPHADPRIEPYGPPES